MTAKQYKKLCRIKVERLAKFITACCVIFIMTLINFGIIGGYVGGVVSTILWFVMPDISAYLLEKYYKISHNLTTYR